MNREKLFSDMLKLNHAKQKDLLSTAFTYFEIILADESKANEYAKRFFENVERKID